MTKHIRAEVYALRFQRTNDDLRAFVEDRDAPAKRERKRIESQEYRQQGAR